MLHPICGFVASLVNCFADSWYGELCTILAPKLPQKLWVSFERISAHQKRPLLTFWVRFVAKNSAFCS